MLALSSKRKTMSMKKENFENKENNIEVTDISPLHLRQRLRRYNQKNEGKNKT